MIGIDGGHVQNGFGDMVKLGNTWWSAGDLGLNSIFTILLTASLLANTIFASYKVFLFNWVASNDTVSVSITEGATENSYLSSESQLIVGVRLPVTFARIQKLLFKPKSPADHHVLPSLTISPKPFCT